MLGRHTPLTPRRNARDGRQHESDHEPDAFSLRTGETLLEAKRLDASLIVYGNASRA
jgi:hypothetical protein